MGTEGRVPDRATNGTTRGWPEPERLRLALDAASDAFFEVDVAAGTIKWSPGITLLFGHDPERVGSAVTAWQKLIHPDEAPDVMTSGAALLPSGASSWSREFRFARADGSYAPVRARSFVLFEDGKPAHVVGALMDLSEIREREAEIQELNEELSRAVEQIREERSRADTLMRSASLEVFGEWDLISNATSWSPNVTELLGYPPEELSDRDRMQQHIHPEDVPLVRQTAREAVEKGVDSWTNRYRWLRPDGSVMTLATRGFVMRDAGGRPVRALGTISLAPPEPARPVPLLTERQRQVLRMVRAGRSNKEIAAAIGTSEQGAKAQVSKLLRKFGAENRASLVAAADEFGIGD